MDLVCKKLAENKNILSYIYVSNDQIRNDLFIFLFMHECFVVGPSFILLTASISTILNALGGSGTNCIYFKFILEAVHSPQKTVISPIIRGGGGQKLYTPAAFINIKTSGMFHIATFCRHTSTNH